MAVEDIALEQELEELTGTSREPFPTRFPLRLTASGLYEYSLRLPMPQPLPLPVRPPMPEPPPIGPRPGPVPPTRPGAQLEEAAAGPASLIPLAIIKEQLRLDVDGRYPQMTASGTLLFRLTTRLHWIASLTQTGPSQYSGGIWYKDGDATALQQTNVTINVVRSYFTNLRSATATFTGGGAPNRTVHFHYVSPYFQQCEFEYDNVQGTTPVTSFDTSTHPNKPASLPNEVLTIATVYQRAGINASVSPGSGVIPITMAGGNMRWSDAEMHDAMIQYWSRFANAPQWAAWVLFAALSESGASLGGIMFDSIGPNHRQGTAIFEDSFIATPPSGDPHAAAFVQRMKFWTACHEIGHTFNLAHSWQKSLGTSWIPLADEPNALSFMNYPYRFTPGGSAGTTAFFSAFEYRFSDSELLFVRHAPARFVEQGFADWFDHHGFRQAVEAAEPTLQLELRLNRPKPEFEFLEPVVVELKLKNVSSDPQFVDNNLLKTLDHMTIVAKRLGSRARVFKPFARYCYRGERKVLMPGEAVYDSLFVSVGQNGWTVAEPGIFTLQVALHDEAGDIVSNPLTLRITPPKGYDEEYLAQDLFTEDVGRVLTFDGSRVLDQAMDVLQEISERLDGRRVAAHARIAIAATAMREFKSLQFERDGERKVIVTQAPDPEGAVQNFNAVLRKDTDTAAETLGHVDTKYYTELFTDWLAASGRPTDAVTVLDDLIATFEHRGVLPTVIADLRSQRQEHMAASGVSAPPTPTSTPVTPRPSPGHGTHSTRSSRK